MWDLVSEVGLFRLRGHKDQITGLSFLDPASQESNEELFNDQIGTDTEAGFIISTGKDSLLKLWDLDSRHCIETHVVQTSGECWALASASRDGRLITAGNDGELRFWSIDSDGLKLLKSRYSEDVEKSFLRSMGTLLRQGRERTLGVKFSPHEDYFAVHGSEKAVEIWRIKSEGEVQKTLSRKRRRKREKAEREARAREAVLDNEIGHIDLSEADVSEIFVPHVIVRTGGKVRSISWDALSGNKSVQLLVATANNQLETYGVSHIAKDSRSSPPNYSRTYSVDLPGHRNDIRALSISSDDKMLASASNGSLKIWNVKAQRCIRTFDCGYALCCSFLPGDKIVTVGTKSGDLEVFDVVSSSMTEVVKAHEGPIWTLQVHPDGKSMATGSADKTVKFWNFRIVQEEVPGTRRTSPQLRLVHTRTLKVTDDVLSLRFSPDSRLLAVAQLDNTVKIFFLDTLKHFLNLYGHKLPVLNMDISFDSKLIVTCSADKNVRLWGLDFGDCHKAFFAHQDSIMQVSFIPHNQDGNGHHFLSASKDRLIKYWDGDKFEQIQKLDGHHGEIWALAVSRSGDYFISASHDKSIRIWKQTDEQIFLEEEREKELEEMYEQTLTASLEQTDQTQNEVETAGKQTTETLMAGEKIVEALDVGIEDLELMQAWAKAKSEKPGLVPPARNLLFIAMGNISAEQHVLNVIQKIHAAALQDALIVLPFARVPQLFIFLKFWADKGWNISLTCRILFFMLKIHHRQIIASKMMRSLLDEIRGSLRLSLKRQKDEMGVNIAGLRFMGRAIDESGSKDYVDEEAWNEKIPSLKKRGFVEIA